MARYDTAASADSFAASTSFFHTLVTDLTADEAAALNHAQLEELLDARGRELLRRLLQDHLDLRAVREERARRQPVAVVGRDGLPRTRTELGHHRILATLFGTVTVTRCAFRAPGLANVYSADEVLSLPGHRRHSHGLARLAVLEAVRGSFDDAKDAIWRRCGPVIGKRQIEDQVVASAADITAFYAQQTPAPCTAETLLVLTADAKGIVMRPGALRPATAKAAAARAGRFRTRLAAGEKNGRKRMATLACVYDAEPTLRRPHDIIAPPGATRSGDRTLRPGPAATGKWLTGSVADGTQQVIAAAFDQAEARDPGHRRTWVVLVDGARHQLEVVQAEADRRNIAINIIVDLVHVLEYLWGCAWCLHHKDDPAAEGWVAAHALALLNGQTTNTITTITAQAAGLGGARRHGVDACLDYLTTKAAYLRYDRALAAGWPIATGVIEGACRHLVADRLDITGSRWGLPGAEAVLTLRAVQTNGDLEPYLRYHHHQEHQRTYQAEYDLTA